MKKQYIGIIVILVGCLMFISYCRDSEYELPEVETITFQKDHLYGVKASFMSSDAKYKASVGVKHLIVRNRDSGDILHRFRLPISFMNADIKKMQFNKNESSIILTTEGYDLNFSMKTSSLVGMNINEANSVSNITRKNIPYFFNSIELSDDREILAMISKDGIIRFWDIFSTEMVAKIPHKEAIALSIKHDKTRAHVLSKNGILSVYNTENIKNITLEYSTQLPKTTNRIRRASISSEGNVVIILQTDQLGKNTVLVYNTSTPTPSRINGYNTDDDTLSVACNSNGDKIATSFVNHLGEAFISVSNLDPTDSITVRSKIPASFITFDKDNKLVILTEDDRQIISFDIRTKSFEEKQINTREYPSILCSTGNMIVTDSIYDHIHLINTDNPKNSFVLDLNDNGYYFYSSVDGIFTVPRLAMIKLVKSLEVLPESHLKKLCNKNELVKRLYEYRGYISNR